MKIVSCCITVLMFIQVHAQDRRQFEKDSTTIASSGKSEINLHYLGESISRKTTLPFSKFVFEDVRADSSYFGTKLTVSGWNGNRNYKRLVLLPGVAAAFDEYYNKHPQLSFSPNDILRCYIRQARLVELDSSGKQNNTDASFYRMTLEVEGYLERGENLFPALRIDTVMLLANIGTKEYGDLSAVLDAFALKASAIDTSKVFRKKGYNLNEIRSRYTRVYEKAILTTHTYQKGVYQNFREFIDNAPSIKEYEFRKDKHLNILYTKSNGGDWLPEHQVFGFCDGKTIWINANFTFRPLVRQGNTFEFLSDRLPTSTGRSVYVPGSYGLSLGASVLASSIT